MANSPQTRKRARQNDVRREHNRSIRSAVRTSIKNLLKLIETKDGDKVMAAYRSATSSIDKAAGKGLYHKKYASRIKSRLNSRVRALSA